MFGTSPVGLTHLLEAAAQRTPHAIAVECEGRTLSYAELHSHSNRLAAALRKRGIGRDILVAICLDRSLEMVVALLGVLKAGGAYVPVDPFHGEGRIRSILDDAQARVLITQQSLLTLFGSGSPETILMDAESSAFAQESSEPVNAESRSEDLAYVIFTSGSTGRPKGVEIEHRSLVNFLLSMQREPGFTSSDTLLAVTTLAFDIAGLEMYLPLISGGKIVIAPRSAVSDGAALARLLVTSGATVMQATPVTWRLLLESGWAGDPRLKVLVGGEALPLELGRQLAVSAGEVWNLYGPTETTIWSTLYRVTGTEDRPVPIGGPIANTSLYVLDAHREPVAPGEPGELYIGGEGLARGYLRRPELTADRFVHDPFSNIPAARMYRTGDVVRQNEAGLIEYLGRTDHQVKIRGFRIELGEIESVLERFPYVRHAVVTARDDRAGEKRLAAYVIPALGKNIAPHDLRNHVAASLPDYMVPSAYMQLDEFPLTANNKVDRKALPEPEWNTRLSVECYIAPRTNTERELTAIWEDVLGIRPISITANFFELGGRSLAAVRLFTKIQRRWQRDLPLSALFAAPTIEALAQALEARSSDATGYQTLIPIKPSGSKTPFFCIHGGAGSTLFLESLARYIDPDQPFYGIEPEGLDGCAFKRPHIEQMASAYIEAIRQVQPAGPYHLGGYCFGGIVAFEMAQQLARQGDPPHTVALFSAPLRFNRLVQPQTGSVSQSKLEKLLSNPKRVLHGQWRKLIYRIRAAWDMGVPRLFLSFRMKVPQVFRTGYVDQMLRSAEMGYKPKPYEGKLTLFRGRGIWDETGAMGWEGLAREIETRFIGETATQLRRDIMDEPLVTLLAAELGASLSDATSQKQDLEEAALIAARGSQGDF